MDAGELVSLLSRATGALNPGPRTDAGHLVEARRALAAALVGGQTEASFLDSGVDPSSPGTESLPEDVLEEIRRIAEDTLAAGGEPGLRVVRRELPVRIDHVSDSVPGWAAGWLPEKAIGPFLSEDGRRFWIDIRYRRRQVSLVNALTGQIIGLIPHELPVPAALVINLQQGSVWLDAAAFDPACPPGSFFGVRVRGGNLHLSALPLVSGAVARIAPGTAITLELNIDSPVNPVSVSEGGDARGARADLPSEIRLALVVGGGGSLMAATDATAEAYGEAVSFRAMPGAAPRFLPGLGRLLFPFESNPHRFDVSVVYSDLFPLSGQTRIEDGGWAPVLAIPTGGDPANLGSVDGAGAMVMALGEGLQAEWPFAEAGEIRLGPSQLAIESGRITLAAQGARSAAQEALLLWPEKPSLRRSLIELTARKAIEVSYYASAEEMGGEVVRLSGLRCAANLDRPVLADGGRVPFMSEDGAVTLSLDALGLAFGLTAQAGQPVDPVTGQPQPQPEASFALSNTLLRVASAAFLRVSGVLSAAGAIESGSLSLAFPLLVLLPTLPDPYASNLTLPRRHRELDQGRAGLIVVPTVSWQPAVEPWLNFNLRSRDKDWSDREVPIVPAQQPQEHGIGSTHGQVSERDRRDLSALEEKFARAVGRPVERFVLLDMSSHADQFGVGFGLAMHRREGAEGPVLGLSGVDLVTAAWNLTVFTLPAFHWEPVYNLPNSEINEVFPPSLFSDTDGGPTRLAVPTASLVPVAPQPALSVFLKDMQRETDQLTLSARFTLPFGIIALSELGWRRIPHELVGLQAPDFTEVRPDFQAAGLTGGLQVSLRAPLDLPGGPPPSLPGAALQLDNGHERHNFNPGALTSVLAPVKMIFNGDFGPNATAPRVPVVRIDLSGYGASLFSDWRYPEVPVPGIAQARFDAILGRTLHEVVQAKSLMYPWGVTVVRTITMQRTGSAGVFRRDSGWQAASDGKYDMGPGVIVHPGVVLKLVHVRRIRDTSVTHERSYPNPNNAAEPIRVLLTQVLFDAEALIENATLGADRDGLVTMRDVIGYVQIRPDDGPLSQEQIADLIRAVGPVGGPIDCELDVGRSGLHMRLTRVEVDRTVSAANNPHFVAVARGAVELPNVGQWSVAYRGAGENEPHHLAPGRAVPLIRDRIGGPYRFSEPSDLHQPANPETEYYLLQSTGAQRMLVPRPHVLPNDTTVYGGSTFLFADMYSLAGGVAYFPRSDLCHTMPANTMLRLTGRRKVRLEIPPQPGLSPGQFPISLPERTLSKASALQVRSRFRPGAVVEYKIDSDLKPDWSCRVGPVGILGDFDLLPELMQVVGTIVSSSNEAPQLAEPQMEFGGVLSPVQFVIDLLTTFGLPFPFGVSLTNNTFAFKSGADFSFPLGKIVDELVDAAIKAGPGLMVEVELKTGFGKEADKPGAAYDGALSDSGTWHFYLELASKVQQRILPPFPVFLGGGSKIQIAGKSEGETEVSIYWSAIGTIEAELPLFIKIAGSRSLSIVSRFSIGVNKIGLGVSEEREVEGELLEGLAAVKLSFEMLLIAERHNDDFGLKGSTTLAFDVTYGWIFNKTFEVEFEVDEKLAAAFFIATTVLPMARGF
ncbi:hypothetical protein HPT29_026515 (plasmid) [Microvirga terrae]|uniref:Uncharacterized protein n=1 Tax=Microvirga terrae TaxID=2740529 RepID=A0ABY5S1U7_9HYPH|nr:hypothetical protein [Microvirga terrae]UVF22239.1 hypothetical protein HPT29_026515 [Microvirga terrae]